MVRNQVQAANYQDLVVHGVKYLLYKACSVFCTSVPCVFFKVCSMYCTRCALAMCKYYTECDVWILHQNLAVIKTILISNLIYCDIIIYIFFRETLNCSNIMRVYMLRNYLLCFCVMYNEFSVYCTLSLPEKSKGF